MNQLDALIHLCGKHNRSAVSGWRKRRFVPTVRNSDASPRSVLQLAALSDLSRQPTTAKFCSSLPAASSTGGLARSPRAPYVPVVDGEQRRERRQDSDIQHVMRYCPRRR